MATDMLEGYVLSPQQERVWLLQQGEQGEPYRAQCVIRVEGNLDPRLLTTALQQVIERHEVLRTTFHGVSGLTFPLQMPGAAPLPSWPVEDWCDLSAQEQASKLEALWDEAQQWSFDLTCSPLLQLRMVRLASTLHVLLCSLPALCADRATLTNLVRDLGHAYAAGAQGATLSDTPMQYVDVSTWQHALLTAAAGEADRAYWRQQLVAELLHVRLPGELLPLNSRFTIGMVPVPLAPELAASIEDCASHYHTSTAVFLLACWTLLLWRHLGQATMLIGTAYDGRNYEPLHDALGLFVKYVPIRCELTGSDSFIALLEQLHATTQEAHHRQEYFAWEYTADQAESGPEAAFLPLCFEFAEQPAGYTAAAVSFVIDRLYACTERFKIKLVGIHKDGALSAALHYDSQALPEAMVICLAEQWQTLLAGASQHPETAIGHLQLLSAAERQRLVVTFNQTQRSYGHDQCLHQLFEAQTVRTPDNIAVVCGEQHLTYTSLNARANQLAHHLQRLGVGPDERVGICLERSLEMLIGILGILKAGGAYVPLDPAYPRERLAFMAADVQAPVLLTQTRFLAEFPQHGPHVVCLDADWEAIAQYSTAHPTSAVTPAHLAYVIYTSGSTGQPKGVLVRHQNVVHSTQARRGYYQEPISSFLLLSPFAFDSSVAGLFGTLCQGGTLLLPSEGWQGDPGHLTTLIAQHHVSHVLSLPSLYALLLEQSSGPQLAALRTVIVAGEACPRALVTRHYERLPATALFNEYGPTEGTVWSSVHHCQLQDVSAAVPIGQPIANVQIYLLDTQLQPVPIGVPGELYIGGDGVTAGYFNHAALTAERFLPHPYSAVPGVRLYKTGDLGRYRTDGTIEFLGRTDHQVKIRGFRIEPGEIAAALQEHPAITEAIVVVREISQQQRLIAYVVTTPELSPSPGALRRFLQVKLPDYMVPALFVRLTALPLAPNGKVDHQALPAAETLRPASEAAYVAPATEVERSIATIWQEVLQVDNIGMHDNFFDLGGHSLAMVQVHSKLQSSYSTDLSLVDMFRYPTLSALVGYLSQQEQVPCAVEQSDDRATTRRDAITRQRQLRQERRGAAPRTQHE